MTEISPRAYQLLRLGNHFSIRASVGTETLVGPELGGSTALQYSAVFG